MSETKNLLGIQIHESLLPVFVINAEYKNLKVEGPVPHDAELAGVYWLNDAFDGESGLLTLVFEHESFPPVRCEDGEPIEKITIGQPPTITQEYELKKRKS